MTIEQIFKQYKEDRKRYRAIEGILRRFPSDRDRLPLEQEMYARGYRIALVEQALVSLSVEEREVLYYRYQYGGADWEWRRVYNMYMSRSTVYRRLSLARKHFLDKFKGEG